MSSNLVTIINRLFTAIILVALLIACQEMPEGQSRDFDIIRLERSSQ